MAQGWPKGVKRGPMSEEQKRKIGDPQRGVPKSKAHRARIARGMRRYKAGERLAAGDVHE